MASASSTGDDTQIPADITPAKRKSGRRKTSHLKQVPEPQALRDEIRNRCREITSKIDKSRPMTTDEMEVVVRQILADMELEEHFIGWTMVMFASIMITSSSTVKMYPSPHRWRISPRMYGRARWRSLQPRHLHQAAPSCSQRLTISRAIASGTGGQR